MRNKSIFSTSSSPEWTGTVNSDKKMASALDIHRGSSESVSVPILRATEVGERWPVLLWFYLKTLGLYHSGFLVRSKLCNRCAKSKTHTALYYTDNQCKVCDSLTWDYKGVPTVVTDNEIGSSFLNHCGSGFLSMMWLLLITGITLANIVLLIARYANSGCDIVHVLAWIGMKLLLYIGPFICFVSVVHATWPSVFMGSWSNALAVEFLVHRMRFVNMKDKQFAGYVLFLGSVVVMGTQCLKITAPYFDPELVSPMVANETLSSLTLP